MARRQHSNKFCLAVTLTLLLSTLGIAPAKAQYSPFGYSPLTGASNMFWPMRMLLSPGSMLFRGGYGYNAPYYVANTLTYNAAYAAGQGINGAARQNYMNHYWNPANGINAPVVDQVSVAPWYYPPRVPPGTPVAGDASNIHAAPASNPSPTPAPANNKNSEFMPVPAALSDSSPSPAPALSAASAATLAPAPDFRAKQTEALPPAAPQAAANSARSDSPAQNNSSTVPANSTNSQTVSSNPFAQAFIDHVNSKFQGDIARALSDKQTRNYATALGILEHGPKDYDIPADRIELIKRIMQDTEEDSLTKVNTIRLLIKH